jgi:hypothetical protein
MRINTAPPLTPRPPSCRRRHCTPTQASPAHAQPHTCLAIDVTITPPPSLPLPATLVNPHNPHAVQGHRAVHWKSTRNEFQGRRHGTMANLNQAHLTLIPFSIDRHGSLGCFAICLLYDPSPPDNPLGNASLILHLRPRSMLSLPP